MNKRRRRSSVCSHFAVALFTKGWSFELQSQSEPGRNAQRETFWRKEPYFAVACVPKAFYCKLNSIIPVISRTNIVSMNICLNSCFVLVLFAESKRCYWLQHGGFGHYFMFVWAATTLNMKSCALNIYACVSGILLLDPPVYLPFWLRPWILIDRGPCLKY